MANEVVFKPSNSADFQYETQTGAKGNIEADAGQTRLLGWVKGAIRFNNVTVNKGTTVNSAMVNFYITERFGSGEVKSKVYGIDENNTANFFDLNAFGRDHTTAWTTTGTTQGAGEYWNFDVKDIVNEIFARDGWSSGNSLGILIEDNGTASGADLYVSSNYEDNSRLVIRVSAEPDFTPTPITVDVPTFPGANSFGMKFSKPGVNVLTATEAETYFTTRKKSFKIHMYGQGTCDGGNVWTDITHGLDYIPSFLIYGDAGLKASNFHVKVPRQYYGADDPLGFEGDWMAYADTNKISVNSVVGGDFIYYIFLDPLEE